MHMVINCNWTTARGSKLASDNPGPHPFVRIPSPPVALSPCRPVALSPGPRLIDTPTRPFAAHGNGMQWPGWGAAQADGSRRGRYGLRFTVYELPKRKGPAHFSTGRGADRGGMAGADQAGAV
jgi:hypothetical protein